MHGPDRMKHGRDSLDPATGAHPAADARPSEAPLDPVAAGHENAEVGVEPVVKFLVWLGAAAFIIFVLMFLLYRQWIGIARKEQPPLPPLVAASRGRLPPEPRLQITPLRDYEVFRAAQDSLLDSYGWVNRDSGVVRIPIESAMERIARQGLPVRSAAPPDTGTSSEAPPSRTGPETSGRLPRGDLRLRPPLAPVEPAPNPTEKDSIHRQGGRRP